MAVRTERGTDLATPSENDAPGNLSQRVVGARAASGLGLLFMERGDALEFGYQLDLAVADDVAVFCCDTTALSLRAIAEMTRVLSETERGRAERFRNPQRRQDYVAAHALLREVLSRRISVPARECRFTQDCNGKPCLTNVSPPVAFSLSHTRGFVACATSQQCEVGIDVEIVNPTLQVSALRVLFSIDEERELRGLPPSEHAGAVTTLWTMKEALAKATGLGLAFNWRDVTLALAEAQVVTLPEAREYGRAWRLVTSDVQTSYKLALASALPIRRVEP